MLFRIVTAEMLKIKILSEDIREKRHSINLIFAINVLIANNVCSVEIMTVVRTVTVTT